jgi:DNA-binding CsgD family transcriptional regulator
MPTQTLIGRDLDLGELYSLVDRAPERGGAMVVRGEAGIGKSALLAATGQRARERGMLILTASGVQSEANLPFAGLHQLLLPVLRGIGELPGPQQDAIQAAFGMTDAPGPDLYLIALATLELLSSTAAQSPLLLRVDDAHWLDRSTCDVLAFVARRLASEPIVLLIAIRDGFESVLLDAGLPELTVTRLDDVAAGLLLDAHAPDLPSAVRARVLSAAVGNPMALVELPVALAASPRNGGHPLPAWLPLTTRLERAFAARLAEFPAATGTLLLVAAIDDGDDVTEILSAATSMLGDPTLTTDGVEPAITARLVHMESNRLQFRHPLIRSAVHQAASDAQRRAAHAALAGVLDGQPDRQAWHHAAASAVPNEAVASELEAAASRARRRGAVAVAGLTFERAAELSEGAEARARRLLRAAEQAFELGRREDLTRSLRAAASLNLTDTDRARITVMTMLRDIRDDGVPEDSAAVRLLVDLAEQVRSSGDTNLALNLLLAAAVRCWWADPGEQVREAVIACAERASVPHDDPQLLGVLAMADPIGRGATVIECLSGLMRDARYSPRTAHLLCGTARAVGAFELSMQFAELASAGLRAQGRLAPLAQLLVMRASVSIYVMTLDQASLYLEEGTALARETGQLLWEANANAIGAMVAGLRGDEDAAEAHAAAAERLAPTRPSSLLAEVQRARGVAALGVGRYADAFNHLHRIYDPTDVAYHRPTGYETIDFLAEAGARSGHRAEALAQLQLMEPAARGNPAPHIQNSLRQAAALLADDADAASLFGAALDSQTGAYPLDRARLQLAYGIWLRRHRRRADSRVSLHAARDTLDTIGAIPWSERARQELRAAGEVSRRRGPHVLDLLTPQELQIARMAAAGLSNKRIGAELFLSHRTVGVHLYRLFPKLGITSRAALRDALAAFPSEVHSRSPELR